jgi:TRAP-type C4-dicarboxylate transport system permease small subunit
VAAEQTTRSGLIASLRRAAEGVLVIMMGIMFTAFVTQVIFRYLLNLPLAWSEEICNFIWLWGILWGASFVMRNHEDIRFDMLYSLLPRAVQRASTVLASSVIVVLLALSLPMTWSYISFMHVEKSAAMGIPMSWVFGLYLVFVIAMCVRHAGIAWNALRGRLTEDEHSLIDQHLLQPKKEPV